MTQDAAAMADVMREIRHLAATRRHHLADSMTGTRSLAPAQAQGILAHLRGCPERDDVPLELIAALEARMEQREIREVPRETEPAESAEPAHHSSTPPPLAAFKDVPAGFYATPGADDEIDFWKVTKPGKGKWAGWAFVRRVLGGIGVDEGLRTVELSNIQKRLAFAAITGFGLDKAQDLFAGKMERCISCGSPLTNDESRAARQGPTCRAKKNR